MPSMGDNSPPQQQIDLRALEAAITAAARLQALTERVDELSRALHAAEDRIASTERTTEGIGSSLDGHKDVCAERQGEIKVNINRVYSWARGAVGAALLLLISALVTILSGGVIHLPH